MTEAIGMSGMIETPIVCVDVQRAGPATGVPTKTEQGDLWQVLGAGQGDYPRIIVAPADQLDLFKTIPELFNLADKYQCPGLVLADLLISEGTASVDPSGLDFNVEIDRGEIIFPNGNGAVKNPFGGYTIMPISVTEHFERISPRAVPGMRDTSILLPPTNTTGGTLISDEFTNPAKRRMMVEKRRANGDHPFPDRAAETAWSEQRCRHAGRLGFNGRGDSRSPRETRGRRRDCCEPTCD
jgi:2-oxoglutarate ferredoxin oxidoreductase subunit alpha